MKGKDVLLTVVATLIVLFMIVGLFWITGNKSKNNKAINGDELIALQTTFAQQYGSQATIKELVSPNKVYAALWYDSDNVSYVSWNIGGLWCIVWSSSIQ